METKTQISNAFRKVKLYKTFEKKHKQTFYISRKILHCILFQKQTQSMFSRFLNVVSKKYIKDLENFIKLTSLESQIKAVRLQDKLGKQNF